MKRLVKKIIRNEDGQALVLFALLLVVLMGFTALVIDVGKLRLTKTHMQNAADAAALAGAQDLPNESKAKSTAKNYAELNGVEKSKTTVTTSYKGDSKKIEVVCTKNVQYSFGRVLGFTSTDVSARAVANKVANLPSAFTDYAIFSESPTTPLYVGKAGQSKCIGTIRTNNTLHLGKHLDVTRVEACSGITQEGSNTIGSFDDHAPHITMPEDFKTALLAQVTSAPKKYTGNRTFGGNGLDLSESVYVEGDVTITGNKITGKGFIYATGNITISGNKTQIGSEDEPLFIYSEKNITISGNKDTMYCVIYAPNGIIDVQKNNWNLYGRLIGKSFEDSCLKNNFNIISGSDDFAGVPIGDETVKLIE
ncbi:MAG: pilus assembly protein TadG-related protein [Desulfitobacteriaceae bacterium]|nr:pilus assembly protein TadG-related protein [Desulfitobacteriaceae bacterium]MDD4753985.1 pilus assembly protein TadG-related protein [Desulfitobacteriaceae bacterium]